MVKTRTDVIMTKALFCLAVIGWSLQLINIPLLDWLRFCFKMQLSRHQRDKFWMWRLAQLHFELNVSVEVCLSTCKHLHMYRDCTQIREESRSIYKNTKSFLKCQLVNWVHEPLNDTFNIQQIWCQQHRMQQQHNVMHHPAVILSAPLCLSQWGFFVVLLLALQLQQSP